MVRALCVYSEQGSYFIVMLSFGDWITVFALLLCREISDGTPQFHPTPTYMSLRCVAGGYCQPGGNEERQFGLRTVDGAIG